MMPTPLDIAIMQTLERTMFATDWDSDHPGAALEPQCGDCNLCCIAPSITLPEAVAELGFTKPAATACTHCDSCGGCKIYDARPKLCKMYECLYRVGILKHRPDSDGVAWTFQNHECPGGKALLIGHTCDGEAAFKQKSVLAVLQSFSARSNMVTCIVIRDGKTCWSWINGPETPALCCDIDHLSDEPDKSTERPGPSINDLIRKFQLDQQP